MKITLRWLEEQIGSERVSSDREIRLNCPNCDDTSKHLYVNANKSLWYCFKCGVGGQVQTGESNTPNVESFENIIGGKWAKKDYILDNKVSPELSVKSPVKSLPLHTSLHPPAEYAEDCESAEELNARNYLHKRGIIHKEIQEYDISLSLEKSGPYKNTIIFPIRNFANLHLSYFVCRKYDNSKPKYVNAPWPKDDTMFIADANMGGQNYPWVICEGIFDALAIRRIGYNALALLGKTPTSQQLKRLVQRDQYLIYLDEDAFTHAINLKLQLNAVGTRAKLVVHKLDAAQLYLDDTPLLRTILDGATKQLNEYKKS